MATDIFSRAERLIQGDWTIVPNIIPFKGWSNYRLFAFLAGVRNYAGIEPISLPRGLPMGVKKPRTDRCIGGWLGDHSYSWLSLSELLTFDYDQIVEDRRCNGMVDSVSSGAFTCEPGQGQLMTLRQFLSEDFFDELSRLEAAGVERIVFGFD